LRCDRHAFIERKHSFKYFILGGESQPAGLEDRVPEENRSTRLRRILVRLRDAAAGAYPVICADGCNKVDGPKDKQNVDLFSSDALNPNRP
jgi:hypothetical protein